MATFTGAIGTGGKWLLDRIVGGIAATGINPNLLTFLGLLVNFGAAASFAVGNFRTGAIIIFLAGFLDMLDGRTTWRGRAMCSRCGPAPAASCNAWDRRKRAWTWRASRDSIPPA